MNLRSVDIRLLVVFDAVMAEGGITAAALRLGMSQPAVSNAINRLRHILQDELFLRGAGGMRPTQRAKDLAGPVRSSLGMLESALDPKAFSPGQAVQRFNIAMSYNTGVIIAPLLWHRVRQAAPGVRLGFRHLRNIQIPAQLDARDVDFVIGMLPELPPRIRRRHLFNEERVCVMDAGHPLARRKTISKAEFIAADHIAITAAEDQPGYIDNILAAQNARRRVVVAVDQILLAPQLIQGSRLVLTAYKRMVEHQPAFSGFAIVPFPYEVEPSVISVAWHEALSDRPSHDWLKSLILDVTAELRSVPDA